MARENLLGRDIEVLDSTMREGEQTPGVNFSVEQKLEIAGLLDQFGIDTIEAGHPAVSKDIHSTVKKVAGLGLDCRVLAHCRAMQDDIDKAIECGVDWIGIFYCLTDKSLEQRYRKDFGEVVHVIVKAVEYAKDHGLKVRYTPEDTVRSDFGRVVTAAQAAVSAGADRISIADTTGIMTPLRMQSFVKRLRKKVKVDLNVHCHNDLGMATANSLTAIAAGAKQVDVTVNGLGERTGIAPLAETCMALKLRFGVENKWDMTVIPKLSKLVEKYSGIRVPVQAPIVGKNAFTHNAGLHVAAVLIDPKHYESIPVELLGRRRELAVDRMAGKPTIRFKLRELGINVFDDELEKITRKVKRIGDRELTNSMLKEIVRGVKRSSGKRKHGSKIEPDDDSEWWEDICHH